MRNPCALCQCCIVTVPYSCVAEGARETSSESHDLSTRAAGGSGNSFSEPSERPSFRIDNPRHRLRRPGNDGVMLGLEGAVVASLDNRQPCSSLPGHFLGHSQRRLNFWLRFTPYSCFRPQLNRKLKQAPKSENAGNGFTVLYLVLYFPTFLKFGRSPAGSPKSTCK